MVNSVQRTRKLTVCVTELLDHAAASHCQNSDNHVYADPDCYRNPILFLIADAGFESNHRGDAQRSPNENRGPQTWSIGQGAERGDCVSQGINRDHRSQNNQHHGEKTELSGK